VSFAVNAYACGSCRRYGRHKSDPITRAVRVSVGHEPKVDGEVVVGGEPEPGNPAQRKKTCDEHRREASRAHVCHQPSNTNSKVPPNICRIVLMACGERRVSRMGLVAPGAEAARRYGFVGGEVGGPVLLACAWVAV
jgi:hypothetical protein